ncbi:MAG TPA: DUF1385 domain-containing protein [Thermotoga sp.]|nr:DUF1385 domain-containing protein [Thermotoga sp.]
MKVGGQAIIEGVMMIGNKVAIAVRNKEGSIVTEILGIPKRGKVMKIPFLRGFYSLYLSLYFGMKALTRSAEISSGEKMKKSEGITSILIAFAIAIGLFVITPLLITNLLTFLRNNEFLFSLIEGVIRVILFLIYVWIISFFKDVKRLFQYHGAEHKTIHAFENSEKLEVKNVIKYPTIHPRCGTNFIMIFLIVSILLFSFLGFFGEITIKVRILSRIILIPVVAGISYEFLKIAAIFGKSKVLRLFFIPGLALQYLTTSEPDESQIEVAITALKASLEKEDKERQNEVDEKGIEFLG